MLSACRALKKVGGPDVEQEALEFIQTSLEFRSDEDVVGKYGSHSNLSRETSKWYDEKGAVTD